MDQLNVYNFGNKMYCHSKKDGDTITFKDWRYCDNDDENTSENFQKRICPSCGLNPTKDGHDPCIANLPGVMYACCGHGLDSTERDDKMYFAYIKFSSGKIKRFKSTEELKKFVKDNILN